MNATGRCAYNAPAISGGQSRQRRAARMNQRKLDEDFECFEGQQACPLSSGQYECLDLFQLTSCGNCDNDCTTLPGVASVG